MQKYMLVDDMDGTTENAETIRFGLDGQSYEIDLAGENLEKFYVALDKYVNVARKTEASPTTARRASRRGTGISRAPRAQVKPLQRDEQGEIEAENGPSATVTAIGREDRKPDIREWASKNGIHIGARGRIAKTIQDQYDAAMAEVG